MRTGQWPYLFAALATAAIFLLAACSSMLKQPPGVSYGDAVRQLGIYPVYPPREDLQVGDIYGIENNPNLKRSDVRTVFVDSFDLTKQIREYMNRRYVFADTSTGGSQQVIHGVSHEVSPSQSDAPSGGAIFDGTNPENLAITALPAIEVDSGLTFNLAAGSSSLGAMFGFGGAQTIKMRLSYGRVTSYSVPIPVALEALRYYCNSKRIPSPNRTFQQDCSNEMLTYYLNEKYQVGTGYKDSVTNAIPLMVSKVYLARTINYTFNDRRLAAAAASVANRQENARATAPTIDGSLLTSAVSDGNADVVSALAEFQRALNQSVTLKDNVEGASFSLAAYDENSVTFQEVYQRPVVIGYEGVYLPATDTPEGQY
jgi:hypothetical protein